MKNLKIEVHILQNFAPANLNRDDANMPKEAEFGGFRRARISSQCLKRSIRKSEAFAKRNEVGFRTKSAHKKLINEIFPPLQLEDIAKPLADGILSKIDNKYSLKEEKNSVLYYTHNDELIKIAKIYSELLQDSDEIRNLLPLIPEIEGKKKKSKEEKETIEKINKFFSTGFDKFKKQNENKIDTVDVALFGRMLASTPQMKIDAACQVAHAISTNKLNSEFDFFTAVDDLNEGEEQGAGMMGSLGFNSSCFYRYAMIDANKLTENLFNKPDMAKNGILGFIEGSIEAIPTGKQTSHAAQNRPAFLMVEIKQDGMPMSLANAFATPVKPDNKNSLIDNSIEALNSHYEATKAMYGDNNTDVFIAALDEETLSVPELIESVGVKLDELMAIKTEQSGE